MIGQRTRGYTVCPEPLDTPVASPTGNPSVGIPALGCPVYSSLEPHYTECIFIRALDSICTYLEHNALHPDDENEAITVMSYDCDDDDDNKENVPPKGEDAEEAWEKVPEEDRPFVAKIDPKILEESSRNNKMWNQWAETGAATKWDVVDGAGKVEHGSDEENKKMEW